MICSPGWPFLFRHLVTHAGVASVPHQVGKVLVKLGPIERLSHVTGERLLNLARQLRLGTGCFDELRRRHRLAPCIAARQVLLPRGFVYTPFRQYGCLALCGFIAKLDDLLALLVVHPGVVFERHPDQNVGQLHAAQLVRGNDRGNRLPQNAK